MSSSPAFHPDLSVLKAFNLGMLPETQLGEVCRHLADCETCRKRTDEVSADDFLRQLRLHHVQPASTAAPQFVGGFMQETDSAAAQFRETVDYARAPKSSAALPAGDLPSIPGHDLLEVLGKGGMGIVLRAWHQKLKRVVAVKMIRRGTDANYDDLIRFRTEAEAVAQMQHTNIVQIYEIGEVEGQPYFTLELLEGGTLSQKLASTSLPPRQAAALAETLAKAMHHAHQRGIIHRDLKPGNILLTPQGMPKIADFGLARRVDMEQGQTQTGAILGTPSYMAPEQAAGQSQEVTVYADVYALGAILYEMLTGRPPFKAATTHETLYQVLHQDPIPPRNFQPGLQRDLETICLKCLEKDRTRRYSSAQELADDLRRFLKQEPIQARPTPVWERLLKWVKRRPALAGLYIVSGLAALILVAWVVGLSYSGQLLRERDEKEQQRQIAVQEKENADTQKLLAEKSEQKAILEKKRADELESQATYVAAMRAVENAATVGSGGMILDQLPRLAPLPGSKDRRGFEWHYYWGMCHREWATMPKHEAAIHSIAISPDGATFAAAGSDHRIRFFDWESRAPKATLSGHTDAVLSVAFSPKGKHFASASMDGTVKLWDLVSNRDIATLRGHTKGVTSVSFSPDGAQVVSGSWDGTVRLWNVAEAKPGPVLDKLPGAIMAVSFSPESKSVAFGCFNADVGIWEPLSGAVRILRGHRRSVRALAFSGNGKILVSGSDDGELVCWNLLESTVVDGKEFSGSIRERTHRDAISALAFAPDGSTFASASYDQTVRIWDVDQKRLHAHGVFLGHTDNIMSAAFHPNGKILVTAGKDQTIRQWDRTSVAYPLTIPAHKGEIYSLAFHRDGKSLASSDAGHTVKVWNVESGRELHNLSLMPQTMYGLAFAPDGNALIMGGRAGDGADPAGEILALDLTSGRPRYRIPIHAAHPNRPSWIFGVAVHPDSQTLATACLDHSVMLWNAQNGNPVKTLLGHNDQVHCVAFSKDGTLLASGCRPEQMVLLWDVASGKPKARIQALPHAVAFSPDGQHLITTASDAPAGATLLVWDIAKGKVTNLLKGHTGGVFALAFSPDGRRLASGSLDQTVRLWDFESGNLLATFREHTGSVRAVAFSPDGTTLASADIDGNIVIRRAAAHDKARAHPK